MPCNSEYLASNCAEQELSKVLALMDELDGKGRPDPDSYGNGYDKRAYGNASDERLNELVATLCSRLTAISDVSQYSLEMQLWWRDHQRADERRRRGEDVALEYERKKAAALSKLTDEDRAVLGLAE